MGPRRGNKRIIKEAIKDFLLFYCTCAIVCLLQCVVDVSLPVVCSVNFDFELISCCQSHLHFVYFVVMAK